MHVQLHPGRVGGSRIFRESQGNPRRGLSESNSQATTRLITLVESSFRGSPTRGSLPSLFQSNLIRQKRPAAFDAKAFTENSRDRFGIDEMLLFQYSCRERFN